MAGGDAPGRRLFAAYNWTDYVVNERKPHLRTRPTKDETLPATAKETLIIRHLLGLGGETVPNWAIRQLIQRTREINCTKRHETRRPIKKI